MDVYGDDQIGTAGRPRADHLRASLGVLGIDAASERLYRTVLRQPGLSVDALSALLDTTPDLVRHDVQPLLDRDLVRIVAGAVRPEPPGFALRRIVAREARRVSETARALEQVETIVAGYIAEHQVARSAASEPLTIDVIREAELIDVFETLVPTTSGEMLFLRPDQWNMATASKMDDYVIAAIRTGRTSRVIYPVSVLERAGAIEGRVAVGEQVRLLAQVPSRMAVFGDEAVVLTHTWGEAGVGSALLIRERGVVGACRELFEQLWRRATTVSRLQVGSADAERRALLELLARGAKDEQISRALGLSLRTVRRRVAGVMAELGVDTRFQAGMEAVRRGLL
jgi:DNA-binding CsgD family transcriptional regulator